MYAINKLAWYHVELSKIQFEYGKKELIMDKNKEMNFNFPIKKNYIFDVSIICFGLYLVFKKKSDL